jgi:predicted peroxiredoxin
MPEEETKKVVVIITHGPEDPERASFPFVMANGAMVMDAQATVILQGTGVWLAKKGCYEHVFAPGLPPLQQLVHSFIEQGGKILVCLPCINERKIEENTLVETAEPIATGRAMQEILEANVVLNY